MIHRLIPLFPHFTWDFEIEDPCCNTLVASEHADHLFKVFPVRWGLTPRVIFGQIFGRLVPALALLCSIPLLLLPSQAPTL